MKAFLVTALLIFGLSGPAAAQANLAGNVQNSVGNLASNVTATTRAALSLNVTATVHGLNKTVGDLHQDLTAGTLLETNNNLGDSLVVLLTPHTRLVDNILAGEQSLTTELREVNVVPLVRLVVTAAPTLVPNLLRNPEGTLLNPQVLLAVLGNSILPFNNLNIAGLSGALLTSDGANVLTLGDGLSTDNLPLSPDALDSSTRTALLNGSTLPGL